ILDTETDEERIKKLREKSGTNLPPHFLSLQSKLKENNIPDGKLTPQQIKSIIENLIHPSDAIVEKANIFLLYQYWSSGTTLLSASRKIKTECKKYLEKKGSKTAQKRIIDYYRTDLIAQLYKDFNTAQPYANFDTFLEMSEGLPRNLLIILSNIFNWAIFYGEKPFLTEKPISERAQLSAVKESTDWFLKDVSIFGDEGVSMLNSVKRLGNFFREIRYSDKPGECSLITFSYSTGSIRDESVVNLIDLAVRWSLLIRIPKGQKHKNSKSKTEKVQLSKMLSPYWDLSIARRGTIPLTGEDINCIFKGSEESFESLLKTKTEGMMTPFGYKKKILSTLKNEAKILNASKNPSLFEK
ncbi:MAG TPA: hypothetical protein VNX68_03890, partial [Nitrosopumilaceae archaeon]|nr:hypothetical protein [Nitrosopumilaceae archaeon]